MQTEQPQKKKLTAKSTKFELPKSSENEMKESKAGAFPEYKASFVLEKPKSKLSLKSKPIETKIPSLCSVSTENPSNPQNTQVLNEKIEEKNEHQPNIEPLTSKNINEAKPVKVSETQNSELLEEPVDQSLKQQEPEEEIWKKEEDSRVYSVEFMLKIIQASESAIPVPEFEFITQRAKIEVQPIAFKPNPIQKGQRPDFKKPNPDFKKPNPDRNYPKNEHKEQNGGFERNTNNLTKPKEENPANLWRQPLTKEELEKKAQIEQNLNKWIENVITNKTPEELLQNSIRLQLNILTPDNYYKIKEEIKILAEKSKFATASVCDLLIEKAWNEAKYCKIYAQLCDYLGKIDSLNFDNRGKNYFKSYLIGKIQNVFEDADQMKVKSTKSLDKMTPEEKEIYHSKQKKRILGNMIFIGELLVLKFLAPKVMIYCTKTLLSNYLTGLAELAKSDESSVSSESDMICHEDHIEGLIQLYVIAGKIFEERSAGDQESGAKIYNEIENACTKAVKGEKGFSIAASFNMDQLFIGLRVLRNMAPLTVRIRVLIQNLEDLRNKKWVTPEFMNQTPKTLKEVHQEIERESEASERSVQNGAKYHHHSTKPGDFNNKAPQHKIYAPKTTYFNSTSRNEVRPNEENRIDSQPSKITYEKCIGELKDIYKTPEDNEEGQQATNVGSQITNLIEKSKGSDFVKAFMSTFSDGIMSIIQRRINLLQLCFEKSLINSEDFNRGFGEALYALWMEASDFPGIEVNFARILLMAAAELKGFRIANLYIPPDLERNPEREYILPTYLHVFNSTIGLAEGEEPMIEGIKLLKRK